MENNDNKIKFLIVAGDPSGDIHAARLMKKMKEIQPDVSFVGIGGRNMENEGLKSIIPMEKISIVGFWEVAKNYSLLRQVFNDCVEVIEKEKPSAFIPVDYPGFNIRLANKAKKYGVPVIYYIAPQLWAWGKNRAKKLVDTVDKLLVVFPFEKEYFENYGLSTAFIGHPIMDDETIPDKFPAFEERSNTIALLPGSRKQELKRHIPIMREVSQAIGKHNSNIDFSLAASPFMDKRNYDVIEEENPGWQISTDVRQLMRNSRAGIVKTGTSTLEAALCGMPFVMIYRASFFNYIIGKNLINLPYVSMVNILAGEEIISEYVQNEIDPQKIAKEIIEISENKENFESLQNNFKQIKEIIGNKGASERAAKEIFVYLKIV